MSRDIIRINIESFENYDFSMIFHDFWIFRLLGAPGVTDPHFTYMVCIGFAARSWRPEVSTPAAPRAGDGLGVSRATRESIAAV